MCEKNNLSNRLEKCFSSVVHDVMRDAGLTNFVLDPNIKPNLSRNKIAGQIFTIEGKSSTEFDSHDTLLAWTGLLSQAPSDKVLVCQPNDNSIALMGELSAEYLQLKGVRGYIVDGGCRDLEFINKMKFPVWSKFNTPKDIVSYWKPIDLGGSIRIGDVFINSGDYLIADIDGIAIIPEKHITDILEKSEALINTESDMRKEIRNGMDPQEAYLKYGAF